MHVREEAAADNEGTAGPEASDEHCAAGLAGVDIELAIQKRLLPYHLLETVKEFPGLLRFPCVPHRELDSPVQKEFESKTVGILNLAVCKQFYHFSKLCNLAAFRLFRKDRCVASGSSS